MLHRDIKPSNLIWGKDERIYLVDFGAVQDRAALEGATFTVVGTYGYVPMEQFGGRAVPASDLYALGATLIHLLTGTAPADLPQQDSRLQFAERVSLERGFVNWIGKLVEPNLAERLSNAREALDALDNRHTLSLPIANRKPAGSQIQLKKSAIQLEIMIPPRNGQVSKTAYLIAVGDSVVSALKELVELLGKSLAWILVRTGQTCRAAGRTYLEWVEALLSPSKREYSPFLFFFRLLFCLLQTLGHGSSNSGLWWLCACGLFRSGPSFRSSSYS